MYVVLKVQNQNGSQSGYRFLLYNHVFPKFIVLVGLEPSVPCRLTTVLAFTVKIMAYYLLHGLSLNQKNVKINKNNF